jgi:putative copper export protein
MIIEQLTTLITSKHGNYLLLSYTVFLLSLCIYLAKSLINYQTIKKSCKNYLLEKVQVQHDSAP